MADNINLKYEQINWGWLNDYAGYKFAPITFLNQIYTENGDSFKTEYDNIANKIKTGDFIAKNAEALVKIDGDTTLLYSTDSTKPVYFSKGVPKECEKIDLGTSGTIKAKTFTGALNGNAATATEASKLSSAVTLTIGSSGKTFDGSSNLSWTHAQIGATVATSYTNNILTTTVNGQSSAVTITIPPGITESAQTFKGAKTFTNAITVESSSDTKYRLRHSDLTYGTKPNAEKKQRIEFTDKDDVAYASLANSITSANLNKIALNAYSPKKGREGNEAYAQVYIEIDDDNNCIAGVRSGDKLKNSIVFEGACWNDYAEYRNQIEDIEPGYCVASTNNGKVYKTTEKYQPCDGIVSDTFGFTIGKTDQCKTPVAVSGRVLAYFHGNREDYNSGDTVCAGPEGKIMKMTREEIREYPDRIIGIVSEIPEYEEWNGKKVNNRIWIKVK